jgi:autotransporter translocation and assembly factor TamB
MLKQLVKIFASFVLAITGLCFIAVICLQIFLCTDPAGRIIQKFLNGQIPGQVNWESQNISIFRGRLSLKAVNVLDPEGQKVITAENISVNIGLADILARRLLVESLSVVRPGIFLQTGPKGGLNIIKVFSKGSEKDQTPEKKQSKDPAFNIRINEMSVKNAEFSFKSHGSGETSPTEVIVDDFDIVVSNADFAQKSGGIYFSADQGLLDAAGINFPLDHMSLEAMLLKNSIDPLLIRLKSGNTELLAEGTVADIFSDPAPDIRVDLLADLFELSENFKLKPRLSGNAKLAAHLKGSLKNPQVSLSLESEEFSLGGMDLTGVDLAAGMKDRQVDVSRLKAGLNGGVLEFSGKADLTQAFAGGFASPPTDPEAISCIFELKTKDFFLPEINNTGNPGGKVSGAISGTISGISPENLVADVSARLSVLQLQPAGNIVPFDAKVKLSARLDNGIVSIKKIEAVSESLQISALGSYDISGDHLDINAQVGVADLEKLGQAFGISALKGGKALFEAGVSGKAAGPIVDATLWADRPGFADIAADSLEAQIGFCRGRLDLPFLKLTAGSSEINSSGHIQILKPQTFKLLSDPAIKLTVKTDSMQISDIYPAIKGRVSTAAEIRGSIARPEGEIAADISDLDTGVQTVSKASLRSVIRDRKIILEPLEIFLASRDQVLRAGGWVSFDGQYEFKATSDPIDLSSVNRLRNSGIKGKAALSAHGSGKIDKPGFEAVIRLSGLEAEDISFSDTQIKARLKDNNLFLNVDDPFEARVFYDLAGRNFSAKAEFSETNLTPFLGAGGLKNFSGAMACSIKAEGNAGDIINTRALMKLGLLNIELEDREIVSARDLSVSMENGVIKIPESRIDILGDGYLDIQGAGGFDNSIDLLVKGSIPAAIASDFFEQIESSSGKIDLRAKLKGSVKKPVVTAEALFQDLEASFASTMQHLNSVNGKISLSGEKFIFDGLRGRIDRGDFSIEGFVDLKNYSPQRADLKITTRALPIEVPDTLELQLNSDLKFSGKPDHCELQGDIVVIEGSYFRDVDIGLMQAAEEIGKRRRQTGIRTEIKMPDIAFLKNLELNVGIGSRNPVMVDNNLALLSIRPQLTLTGTADNPLLNGRAEVTEGTVTYRNTEFEVIKGVVDFVNPYRIEPEVDIKAEAEIRKWSITLSVTGGPENLNFQLSSNPPEQDADIVSLLAMGKTTRELADGSGGGASTEEMLANLVADELSKKIKQGTGLDIVEVEYRNNGAEAEDAEEVRVTVGKELSRRLTVKYGVERKSGEMVQQSTGIYKLLENLSLNAFQDTEGDFGGEMRYRLEFR